MQYYPITPVPKPRMTRSDKWKKRPCVLKYRAFADEVRSHKIVLPENGAWIIFEILAPKSKQKLIDTPHQNRPDLDNLLKALFDALFDEDSHIWDVRASKRWAKKGGIWLGSSD